MESKTRIRIGVSIVSIALLGSVAAWAADRPESVAEEQGHRHVAVFAGKGHSEGPIELPPPVRIKPVRDLGGTVGGPATLGFSALSLGSIGTAGSTTTDRIGASLKKTAEELR